MRFDMYYFTDTHMPMVRQMVGPACLHASGERNRRHGRGNGWRFCSDRYLLVDLMDDIPNYTRTASAVLLTAWRFFANSSSASASASVKS